jgi:hypothetical protein
MNKLLIYYYQVFFREFRQKNVYKNSHEMIMIDFGD